MAEKSNSMLPENYCLGKAIKPFVNMMDTFMENQMKPCCRIKLKDTFCNQTF